jgi:hypothetical protein
MGGLWENEAMVRKDTRRSGEERLDEETYVTNWSAVRRREGRKTTSG